jgi:DNA-binding MarR family transcriptional regulator
MNTSTTEVTQFYRAKNYNPEESMGYLMRNIMNLVAQAIEREFGPTDLTNAQWLPLFKLYIGSATTAAELARECNLDAGATTRLLDRLEAKGLCERRRSESDRRVVHIALTEAGTRTAEGIPAVLCEVQNAHLQGFSAEEFETLKSLLRRILDNAKTLNQAASAPAHPSSPVTPNTPA